MKLTDIQNYELEITANCNAQCPICARTRRGMKLTGNNSLSLKDIQHIFPHKTLIEKKNFSLCGTLGDPIVNPECFEISEYLNNNGGHVHISTNAGYNSAEWWKKLATLKNVRVGFAVDGFRETNHIYRVNVNFKIVERSMTAYCEAGGKGNWQYIVFEHNKKEVDEAKHFAEKLGLRFEVRGGGRNNQAENTKHKPRKGNEVELVPLVKKNISQHKSINDKDSIQANLHTVDCRHLNTNYLFVGSDMTLYPCCYLYAYTTAGNTEYTAGLPKDWNCLKTKTINDILTHSNFKDIKEMWSPHHNRYVPKCFKQCGNNGIFLDFNKKL